MLFVLDLNPRFSSDSVMALSRSSHIDNSDDAINSDGDSYGDQIQKLQQFVVLSLSEAPENRLAISSLAIDIMEDVDQTFMQMVGMSTQSFFEEMKKREIIDIESDSEYSSLDFAILKNQTSESKHQRTVTLSDSELSASDEMSDDVDYSDSAMSAQNAMDNPNDSNTLSYTETITSTSEAKQESDSNDSEKRQEKTDRHACSDTRNWKEQSRIHLGLKPFGTKQTRKRPNRKSNCNQHVPSVDDEDRPFECSQCGASFKTKYILRQHMVVHSDEKPFKCMQCDASFKLKNHLTQHLVTHLDKYDCGFCEKSFKTEMKRRAHENKFHRDDRPFQCTQCDSAFKRKAGLNEHIRSVHEKVVNYRCSHCSKGFYYKGSLTAHLRVHTGEKPFQCTICRKAFKEKSALTVHQRNVHGVEKSSIDSKKTQSHDSDIFVSVSESV